MKPEEPIFGSRFLAGTIIAESGTVTVYRGQDTQTSQPVVLKVASGLNAEALRRLAYEAELLSRLSCPHIVPLLAAGREGDRYYLAMPCVGDGSLRDRLRNGPLSVEEALALGTGLMKALEAAHQHGLFHRDIKPENIVLESSTKAAVLIDFGLAGGVEPAGSPAYMAPERLGLLDRPIDERADLYEAGLVLYEALAGAPPFRDEAPGGLLRARIAQEPASLRATRSEVPVVLDLVVSRLLRPDPRDRYQQAASALQDLEDIARGEQPVVGSRDIRSELTAPTLVGREAELQELQEHLQQSQEGVARLVRVVGGSGSGKTRLLEAFAERARDKGARVLVGRAQARDIPIPFQQLISVFRDLADELTRSPALAAKLKPWGEVLATAFAPLHALYPNDSSSREMPPQIVRAAGRLLTELPETTLLLLDDCQWSDSSLGLLLEEILGRKSALLVVTAYRDTIRQDHFLMVDRTNTPIIEVRPLSRRDVRDMSESMAGPLPESALDWIWSNSQGDPFVAESTLRGLVESGSLHRDEKAWQLRADFVEQSQTSRRGAAALASRCELLPERAMEACAVGAIIGRRFEPALVSAALGWPLESVAAGVEEARRRALIWKTRDELAYQFSHDRIREFLLERSSPDRKREWHLKLAEFLKGSEPARVFEIAYHYAEAGMGKLALPFAVSAAELAQKRYAPVVAIEYYRVAERMYESLDQSAQLTVARGLGESLASLGHNLEAEDYYLKAAKLTNNCWERAEIEGRLSLLYCSHNPVAARAAADRALRELGLSLPQRPLWSSVAELWRLFSKSYGPSLAGPKATLSPIIGNVGIAMGSAAGVDGKFGLCLWTMLFGINRLRVLPRTRHLPTLIANFAALFALVGLSRLASSLSSAARSEAEKVEDVLAAAQVANRHQAVALSLGRFEDVVAGYGELVAALEPTGEAWEVAAAKAHAGLAFYYRGDLRTAFRLGQEGLNASLRERDALHYSSSVRLCALAGLGHPKPPDPPEMAGPAVSEAFYDFADALSHLYRGRASDAIEPLRRATERGYFGIHSAPFSAWTVTSFRLAAEHLPPERLFQAKGYLRRAQQALRKALKEGRRHAVSHSHALREAGLLAAHKGDSKKARRYLDSSLEVAQRQKMDYEIAWTLTERGRVGAVFAWPEAESDSGQGQAMLEALAAWLPSQAPPGKPEAALSLVDRFSGVLDTGRRIVACLESREILDELSAAATALLRTQDCRVFPARAIPEDEVSRDLLSQAAQERRTCLRDEGLPENLSDSLLLSRVRSALCAPILVHGKIEHWLYVTHKQIGQLYGEEERRLGDYLTTLAGAALENALNFQERRRAQDRFEALFRWTGVGTAVVTKDGSIRDSNPHFEEMMGRPGPGARIWDSVYHVDRTLLKDSWATLFGYESQPLRLELRCLRATGDLLWAQVTASRPPGEELAVVAFSDISERRLAQIAAFQESERRLLAAELHDGISQPLCALYFRLQAAAMSNQGEDLKDCVSGAKDLVEEVSQLMVDLRNPIGGSVDALEAIREHVKAAARDAGLDVEISISGASRLVGLSGSFLFRLIQEAVTNVRRHAGANRLRVSIIVGERTVEALVDDNGRGFDVETVSHRTTRHLGLKGMKERAELLGGVCEVKSSPGEGAVLRFLLPL